MSAGAVSGQLAPARSSGPSPAAASALLQRKCASCGGSGTSGLAEKCDACQTRALRGGPSIGPRDDALEREAAEPFSPAGRELRRQSDEEEEEELQLMTEPAEGARSATAGARPEAPPIVHDVLRSPGLPLESETRAFMETRFGHDFGRVRVHTDPAASESARAVGALAYTVGRHVVFGAGRYAPRTEAGRHLLAHELGHVLQQRAADAPPDPDGGLRVGSPADRLEQEADALAEQALRPGAAEPEQVTAGAWPHTPGTGTGSVSASPSGTGLRAAISASGPYLAKVDCSTVPQSQCKGIFSCGHGGSGRCWWSGRYPNKRCMCLGEQRREPPPPSRILEVLLILGLSIALIATIVAALLDPEPATKLGLAGLSAAEAVTLLLLLGYTRDEVRGMGLDPDLAIAGDDGQA